jgi:hypothetical protein
VHRGTESAKLFCQQRFKLDSKCIPILQYVIGHELLHTIVHPLGGRGGKVLHHFAGISGIGQAVSARRFSLELFAFPLHPRARRERAHTNKIKLAETVALAFSSILS